MTKVEKLEKRVERMTPPEKENIREKTEMEARRQFVIKHLTEAETWELEKLIKAVERHDDRGTDELDNRAYALLNMAEKRAIEDPRWQQFLSASLAAAETEKASTDEERRQYISIFQWIHEWRFDSPTGDTYETIRPHVER